MKIRANIKRIITIIIAITMAVPILGHGTIVNANTKTMPDNPVWNGDTVTWDCIYFGNYYQNNWITKEPIKWRVLEVNDTDEDGIVDDALIMSDEILDYQRYNTAYSDRFWAKCTLRSWLNGYGASYNDSGEDYSNSNFIDTAFTGDEKSAIKSTRLTTSGSDDTNDKVYLMSYGEMKNSKYGFYSSTGDSETRMGENTDCMERKNYSYNKTYWLRSRDHDSNSADYVGAGGYLYYYGHVKYYHGIRPALHINLKSSQWENAETVEAYKLGISEFDKVEMPKGAVYTGSVISPKITVWTTVTESCDEYYDEETGTYKTTIQYEKTLQENVDYKIIVDKPEITSQGVYNIEIRGINDFNGYRYKKKFTVYDSNLNAYKIRLLAPDYYTYDGAAKEPYIEVIGSGLSIEQGRDYNVSYQNNINAGTAKVTVTGAGDYTGTVTETFTIEKASQSINASPASRTVKASAVRKAAKTYTHKVTGSKTPLACDKLTSAQKKAISKVSISGKNVKITVKKKAKKGTYKIKVYAKSGTNYKASAKKTITIKVK